MFTAPNDWVASFCCCCCCYCCYFLSDNIINGADFLIFFHNFANEKYQINAARTQWVIFSVWETLQWGRLTTEVRIKLITLHTKKLRRKPRIWSHLLKKSLTENFIFSAVLLAKIVSGLRKIMHPKSMETGRSKTKINQWHHLQEDIYSFLVF